MSGAHLCARERCRCFVWSSDMVDRKECRGKEESLTLTLLASRHAAVVDLKSAAREAGRAHQTFLNELSSGRCLLKCFKVGRRWYVRVHDLAAFIDGQAEAHRELGLPRRRGRPTKAETVARRRALNDGASR